MRLSGRQIEATLFPAALLCLCLLAPVGCGGGGEMPAPRPGLVRQNLISLSAPDGTDDPGLAEKRKQCRRYLKQMVRPQHLLVFNQPGDALGWETEGKPDPPKVEDGALRLDTAGRPVVLLSPVARYEVVRANFLLLEISTSGSGRAIFSWQREDEPGFPQAVNHAVPLHAGGGFHVYRVKLRERSKTDGIINRLRLELPAETGRAAIRRIELNWSPEPAEVRMAEVRFGVRDRVVLEGVSRPVLAPAKSAVQLDIPPAGSLVAHIGVMKHEWDKAREGTRFGFRVGFREQDSGGTSLLVLYSAFMDPQRQKADRGWRAVYLDLSQVAGRSGELIFQTGPEVGGTVHWGENQGGLWGSPFLVSEADGETGHARPNIVLISLDTLRADRMSGYGHDRMTTPHLDRLLLEQGAQLLAARSPAPWTRPAHASLFTGLDPINHGVETGIDTVGRSLETLAESLSRNGYRTAAVTGGGHVAPELGFDQGFDVYYEVHRLDEAVDLAAEWIGEQQDRPFFLFFHTYEIHLPYLQREPYFALYEPVPYGGRLQGKPNILSTVKKFDQPPTDGDISHIEACYDSGIAYTDRAMARLLAHLRHHGPAENTVVVLISDHGEEFLEHGNLDHGRSLYDELLHVPLVFRWPGRVETRLRLGQAVSLVDVCPTLLSLAGVEPAATMDGCDLAGLISGGEVPGWAMDRRIFGAVSFFKYGDRKYSLLHGKHKVILHPDTEEVEYYDLENDPLELDHRGWGPTPHGEPAELLEALQYRLTTSSGRSDAGGEQELESLSRETEQRLRALGYVD